MTAIAPKGDTIRIDKMKTTSIHILFLCLVIFNGCTSSVPIDNPPQNSEDGWIVGGLYTVPFQSGGYIVFKILESDNDGVHIRMYSNLYEKRPSSVNEDELFMASYDQEELPLGMGHVPVSHDSFHSWGMEFLQKSTVTEDELEGYQLWIESNGGYF